MITLGELITVLFDRYQRLYRDDRLAAIVTQERVHAVLRRHPQRPRPHLPG